MNKRGKIIISAAVMVLFSLSCIAVEDRFFGNYYAISSEIDPYVMDVDSNSVGNDPSKSCNIHAWEWLDQDNQKFLLIPTNDVTKQGALAASYYIISKFNGLPVDAQTATNEETNGINVYVCDNVHLGKNQQWKIQAAGSFYKILANYGSKAKAINILPQDGTYANGANINLWDWLNVNNQRWSLEAVEGIPIRELNEPKAKKNMILSDLPKLNSTDEEIADETEPRLISEKYIPFLYVKDPDFSRQEQAATNPYYILRYEQFWRRCPDFYQFDGHTEVEDTLSFTQGVSQESMTSLEEITDKKLTAEIAGGYKDIINVKVSGEIGQTNKNSATSTTATKLESVQSRKITRKAGWSKLAYLYQMIDRYTILRMDDSQVGNPIEIKLSKPFEVYIEKKVE